MKQILVRILNSLKSVIAGLFKRSKDALEVKIDFDHDGKDDVTIKHVKTQTRVGKDK